MPVGIWNRFIQWLHSPDIDDAVDRRNAPVMQLLLLFYGLLLPANWAWRISTRGEFPDAWPVALLLDLLVVTLAWISIALIRRGQFRLAVMLFICTQLVSLEAVFFKLGAQSQLMDPTPMMLVLLISGLILGRRALWLAAGLLMVVYTTGFATDVVNAREAGASVSRALSIVPGVVISTLIIAIIIDRSVTALRESLAESDARGRELQREIVERERAQAQLIHAQKVEATGRLASGVAHDFNNILDLVLGYAEQRHDIPDLENRDEREAAFSSALAGITAAASRGTAITRKLLTFSRNDVARPQVFDAGQAIAELQPMLRQLLPRSVNLDLPDATGSLPVQLDRSEFEMMILNIAANARDAMAEGGTFRIRLSSLPDGAVGIALSDTGHGMDQELQRHIFEPFFSTKTATNGTGLGLAVISDLVKDAAGDISVESAIGQGSTFHIRLPSAALAAKA